MLVTIILFGLAVWAVGHIIASVDASQRRARQQEELRAYREEMVRDGRYTDEDIRQRLASMRERHRWENM